MSILIVTLLSILLYTTQAYAVFVHYRVTSGAVRGFHEVSTPTLSGQAEIEFPGISFAQLQNNTGWPVPPSQSWTTCTTGRATWTRVVSGAMQFNTNKTIFLCEEVTDKRTSFQALAAHARVAFPERPEAIILIVLSIFNDCPNPVTTTCTNTGVCTNCDIARKAGTVLSFGGLNALMTELSALLTAKGW